MVCLKFGSRFKFEKIRKSAFKNEIGVFKQMAQGIQKLCYSMVCLKFGSRFTFEKLRKSAFKNEIGVFKQIAREFKSYVTLWFV